MTKLLIGGVVLVSLVLLVIPWTRLRLMTLWLFANLFRWTVLAGVVAGGVLYFWPDELPGELLAPFASLQDALDQASPELAVALEGRAIWLILAALLVVVSWPMLALVESGYQNLRWTWLTSRLNRLAIKAYRSSAADLQRTHLGEPGRPHGHDMSEMEKTAALLGAAQSQAHDNNGAGVRLGDLLR